ncbi:MAG: hypothetical protein R2941_25085 [Desulfobacterales bacterium]
MENDRKKTGDMRRFLPGTSASDLMGKQSVRATFRLSSEAAKMLSIVSAHMRIRQKALLDYLAEDGKTLQIIAGQIPAQDSQRKKKIPKTFVLSRKTLHSLDETAREYHIPRFAGRKPDLCLRPCFPKNRKAPETHWVSWETESVLKGRRENPGNIPKSFGAGMDPLYASLKKCFQHLGTRIGRLLICGKKAGQ